MRPLLFLLHDALACKGEPFTTDANAVADGFVVFLNQIAKAQVRIDYCRPAWIGGAVIDDLLEELWIDAGCIDRSPQEFLGSDLGIARRER